MLIDQFFRDPEYFNVPINELISKVYAKKIAKKSKIKNLLIYNQEC